MPRLLLSFSIFLMMIGMGTDSFAQYQRVLIQLNANNDGEEDFAMIMERLRGSAEYYLQSQIRMIDQSCELSDSQERKLKVASKGAVDKFMVAERDRCFTLLRRYQQQAGFDIEKLENKDKDKNEGEDEDDKEDEEENIRPIRNFAFSLQIGVTSKVADEKRWKDSLKKVLSDEQTAAFSEFMDERDQRIRKVVVDRFIAKIDQNLFMTDEQAEVVRSAIDEEFGELLVKELRLEEQYRPPTLRANQVALEPENAKEAIKLFSKQQLNEWCLTVEPRLRYLKTLARR